THPILTGWIGMTGIAFMLHFGLFHLLALIWKRVGVPVEPLMDKPAMATALSEFWGRRWNRGFNQLVARFVFRPTVRHLNVAGATMLVFAVSGIIHDVVISVPARGGYGLPTLYFLLQGLGILIERTNAGRALGLNRGIRGWLFMALFTAVPAYWLFHPPFIHNVILPMLNAFGATGTPL
ncbi:MAG: MBOAT family protein, partial [Limisphaerales bacterium]